MNNNEKLINEMLSIASELGFDRSVIKIYKNEDKVVKVIFWNSYYDSIETFIEPNNYEIINFGKYIN